MFPVLLLLLIVLDQFVPTVSMGSYLRDTLLAAIQQILPRPTLALMAKPISELNAAAVTGAGAVSAGLAAAWGALNDTWAMMAGLKKAYEVKEGRRWWKVLGVCLCLTVSLGIMGIMALWVMLYGSRARALLEQKFGLHTQDPFLWRIIQWPVTSMLLLSSFTLLYQFGPNLRDRRWRWSVPGAFVAFGLWTAFTLLLRVYENHLSSRRIYADLDAVVALLLWLYSTGAAIFIGGEANSEIQKSAAIARRADTGGLAERRSGGNACDPALDSL